MAKVSWDSSGRRTFQGGIDHAVLYFYDREAGVTRAVPWYGLTSVDNVSDGAEIKPVYIDGVNRFNRLSTSDYAGKITAFTYPPEFEAFTGIETSDNGINFHDQQVRDTFGLSYRTLVGTDISPLGTGYKLHLLYNLSAVEDDQTFKTLAKNVEPNDFSWSVSGVPEHFRGHRPTCHVSIDTSKVPVLLRTAIENIVYGTNTTDPRLPTVDEFNEWS